MPRNTSQAQLDADSSSSQSQGTSQSGSTKRPYLLIIVAVVVVAVVIGFLYMLSQSFGTGSTAPVAGSASGAPIYLSASSATQLIGPVSSYQTFDLFNFSSPVNITYVENLTPYAQYNVTEGWVTVAYNQNSTRNASLQFLVMQATNASKLSGSIASSVGQFYSTSPETQYGTRNGLNYTYQLYENGTANFQSLTGWKDDHVVFAFITSDPGFLVNESLLSGIAANYTP